MREKLANPVIEGMPRPLRKSLLASEAKARRSGDWGDWKTIHFPSAPSKSGWLSEVTAAYRNRVFSVLARPIDAVTHLAISSLSGERPTWWEAQRIKNELAGLAATAVEVYPPHEEVVDGADMYHLWVLPDRLPFTLMDSANG